MDIYGYLLTLWTVKRPCIALSAHWLVVWGDRLQLSSRWGCSFCGVASVYCFIVSFLVSWHKALSHVHTSGWILAGASVVFPLITRAVCRFYSDLQVCTSERSARDGGRARADGSCSSHLPQLCFTAAKTNPFCHSRTAKTVDNVTSRQYRVPKLLLDWADWLIFTLLSNMRSFWNEKHNKNALCVVEGIFPCVNIRLINSYRFRWCNAAEGTPLVLPAEFGIPADSRRTECKSVLTDQNQDVMFYSCWVPSV